MDPRVLRFICVPVLHCQLGQRNNKVISQRSSLIIYTQQVKSSCTSKQKAFITFPIRLQLHNISILITLPNLRVLLVINLQYISDYIYAKKTIYNLSETAKDTMIVTNRMGLSFDIFYLTLSFIIVLV